MGFSSECLFYINSFLVFITFCVLLLDLILSPFIMGILSQSMPLNIGLIVWPTESLHEQIMAARMSFLAEKRPGDV